jgi:tetratricopeptide (TPR) repeat protein
MKPTQDDGVLERNVSTLLEAGGEAPRISDAARARIRAQLVERHGRAEVRRRSPLVAVGLGLAATAAGALIVTRNSGTEQPGQAAPQEPGATWLVADGAKVTELGPRRIRVEGAALIDVEPGRGSYVVETARGTIEVVGTRFLVDAEAAKTTAAVIRGSVKLVTADGSVQLHAGEQAVAEPGRPPSRGPAPRLSHLASWAKRARTQLESDARPLRNGTLFAREPNAPWIPESPLPITRLGVDIVVEDQVARVAIDQNFHNPNPRVMEGMYRFAIPPDASLQRLAMYVDGVLTESAVVERMRARRIYEDVVYRRLDPALLEWAGTGRLSLKVYPLPAQEDKRLLVAYTQSLPKLYDDWTLSVPLPEIDLPVGELGFDVRIKGCANCEIVSPSHRVAVDRKGDDAVVSYREARARIGDSLVLRVRDPRKQAITALHDASDGRYVLVRARPELPRTARAYRPRTWVILDDVSASRDALARRAQHDLIDGFVRELDEDDRVAVIAFDVATREKLAPTRVLDVDRQALRAALGKEGGIGATDLGAAFDHAVKLLAGVAAEDARIVYLGDGVLSSGPRQLDALRAKIAGKAQFVGVGVGDGPDTQVLDALAAATGGYATTIDLADDVGWRAFDLIAALHTPRVAGIAATLVDATGAHVPATVYVRTPQLADGEELEVVAKLAGVGTPVAAELTGTLDGAAWRQRVELAGTGPSTAGYLPRLWAQRHIQARLLAKHEPVVVPPCVAADPSPRRVVLACKTEQEVRAERDEAIRKEVVAMGKRHFLLSRHTSLLVLENDAMYKKYGVEKGAGETWAPYVVPQKIAVVRKAVPTDVAPDAELMRQPLQVFYQPQYLSLEEGEMGRFDRMQLARDAGVLGAFRGTRGELGLGQLGTIAGERQRSVRSGPRPTSPAPDAPLQDASDADEESIASRDVVFADAHGGLVSGGRGTGSGWGRSGAVVAGKAMEKNAEWRSPNLSHPMRLGYPTDTAYDDLTAFVPALVPDAADTWRKELEVAAAGRTSHSIDEAARAVLEAARRAVPAGVYRWGDREIAIDGARRFGWRRTTGADLVETAAFDGTTWTRRYSELGLAVSRGYGDADVALAMAHLPIWIAEPAHYARWFAVTATGPREVTLSRTVGKTTEVAYVLGFDDRHRLIAIRDGAGNQLLAVTWSDTGPTRLRAHGQDQAIELASVPMPDAVAWAHGAATNGVTVELPMRLPAFWEARITTLAPGSTEWRHAQRQRMASLAATGGRAALYAAFDALRTGGGVELGDVVLASGGIASQTTDRQLEVALASVAGSPVADYLRAGRAYGQSPRSERLRVKHGAGFVGALWTLREIVALYAADKDTQAVDRLIALGDRAFDLRLIAASATGSRYRMKAADISRAWDAVARGEYINVARAQAATVLANRGYREAAADRVAQLVRELDLAAAPPNLTSLAYHVRSSRRGHAGWQLMWATWRERVLAGSSYEHVMAMLPVADSHPHDLLALIEHAARLAGDDPERVIAVAQYAMHRGHQAVGHALLEPLVKRHPTRKLHQVVGQIALGQGRTADALAHLEAAQAAGGDEVVSLSALRGELAQILQVARQLAVQSRGAARDQAVRTALAWGGKWRELDPDNPQIDSLLGDLLLAIGDHAEAWRHLSTAIERDPMSGTGYELVARAFEQQGRVSEAVDYWHQAAILDQTNPTPRLRKAQALFALGRTTEADALLGEITRQRWHARWDGVLWEARSLIERGKARVE